MIINEALQGKTARPQIGEFHMDSIPLDQIISTIISVLTLLGLGTVSTLFWKDKHAKKEKEIKQQSKEHKLAQKLERQEEIREVIKEELDPLAERLENIEDKMDVNTRGTVTLLRDRMKCSLDFCKRQRYKSAADMAN